MSLDLPLLLLLLHIVSSWKAGERERDQTRGWLTHTVCSLLPYVSYWRLSMFLCSSSSAVGRWLNRLKALSRINKSIYGNIFYVCAYLQEPYSLRPKCVPRGQTGLYFTVRLYFVSWWFQTEVLTLGRLLERCKEPAVVTNETVNREASGGGTRFQMRHKLFFSNKMINKRL